ncbi:porin family protein [Vibrio tubiashii]|uniref:Porin family protein n=1 Tax=Vibrio tubiashii TaxID=29498 RepID=A0AAE5LI29_9VIBR|nr:outer membrane beta-barrel protein [Vibrio tubiashii]NOI81114.1 porin family protein [Vibrio tubiashii]
MKTRATTLLISLLVGVGNITPVHANERLNGIYLGVDYLQASFLALPSAQKEEDAGYAIQVGYVFPSSSAFKHGVELEYFDAGSVKYTFPAWNIIGSGNIEITGVSLNYKPKYYIDRFYLSAQVGYTRLDAKGSASYTINGQTFQQDFSNKVDDSGLTFGGELGFDVTQQLAIKGGYRVLEEDTNALYAGVALRF